MGINPALETRTGGSPGTYTQILGELLRYLQLVLCLVLYDHLGHFIWHISLLPTGDSGGITLFPLLFSKVSLITAVLKLLVSCLIFLLIL